MSEICKVKMIITGRVQSVWFRGWTVQEARRLGLNGWVRNLLDGSVEAVFAGPEPIVRAMIELCWQGPPYAKVDAIEETPFDGVIEPGFRQQR